jgi:hypothetical protein
MVMNDKYVNSWKEVAIAYLDVLSLYLHEESQEHRNLKQAEILIR